MASTLRQRQVSPSAQSDGAQLKKELIKDAEELELTEGQKFIVPNYTVKQLLDAIPAHCFHRSALRSSLYIVQDVVALSILVWGAYQIDPTLAKFSLSTPAYYALRSAAYMFYMTWAGMFGTGLWIIAHECGHQAFSNSKNINNAVGWVLHSFLLVPYHSWRISHAKHHAATGHASRDEVFVPRTREQKGFPPVKEEAELKGINVSAIRQAELREAITESPLWILSSVIIQQLFGWPAYLFNNASGQLWYRAGTNHFDPKSPIFRSGQEGQIVWSDIGLLITLSCVGFFAYMRGFGEMMVIYGIPYLMVNHWLVLITFLQHTDPLLPHYSANKWTFARGALCTIDRTLLGPFGAICFHGIAETHVAHHISSKIPHYAAWEATAALKEFLGPHYHRSEENMFVSLWKNYRECRFVDESEDVQFYKNAGGVAKRVGVMEETGVSDSGIDLK